MIQIGIAVPAITPLGSHLLIQAGSVAHTTSLKLSLSPPNPSVFSGWTSWTLGSKSCEALDLNGNKTLQ